MALTPQGLAVCLQACQSRRSREALQVAGQGLAQQDVPISGRTQAVGQPADLDQQMTGERMLRLTLGDSQQGFNAPGRYPHLMDVLGVVELVAHTGGVAMQVVEAALHGLGHQRVPVAEDPAAGAASRHRRRNGAAVRHRQAVATRRLGGVVEPAAPVAQDGAREPQQRAELTVFQLQFDLAQGGGAIAGDHVAAVEGDLHHRPVIEMNRARQACEARLEHG